MNSNNLPITNDIVQGLDSTTVPTLNEDVVRVLRSLGEPITLFGEDNHDRRQRLIKFINERPTLLDDTKDDMALDEDDDESEDDDEEFYTPGPEELLEARTAILKDSLQRAKTRIERLKANYEPNMVKNLKHRRLLNSKMNYELYGTQLVPHNTRTISSIKCKGKQVGCGSWDGNLYILDENMNLSSRSQQGYHSEKLTLDWGDLIITGGNEGTINIWEPSDEEVLTPKTTVKQAHEERITKTLFHPCGKYFLSTSFDQTWKLWDLETCEELMTQEGHSKQVLSASFHPDGSILSTGGMDCFAKLWDLRSGKLITNLSSHIQGVYSMDWSSNGVHLATGSGDSSIKIWDLRKLDNRYNKQGKGEIFSIPAHKKLVSDVKFANFNNLCEQVTDENDQNPSILDGDGKILISSSFDGEIKLWSADNWINVGKLETGDRVMNFDLTEDSIFSCHWDKTVKMWQMPSMNSS